MKVRKAEIEDAEVIAQINVETWQNAYKGIIDATYLNERKVDNKRISTWIRIIESSERIVLICENDGEIMGYLSAGSARDNYGIKNEISALYVKPAAQRKGVGSMLIKTYRQTIHNEEFYLYVLEKNFKAAHFYEKNGGIIAKQFNRNLVIQGQEYAEVCYVFNEK
ncbi:MAG: GNAT family N-acetyltransferase [Alphaproteobacteria bacterium]|nr:GNAT family N-acetyltransferase [Alphaproteobacteria bacterium]